MNIDLSEIDLTNQEIEYLIDKGTRYHAARLTPEQRTKFRKGEHELRSRHIRKKIRKIRVRMIADFIDYYGSRKIHDSNTERHLSSSELREILLSPLSTEYPSDKPLDEHYTKHVLTRLMPFAAEANSEFFRALFRLVGDLQCEIAEETSHLLVNRYRAIFGDTIGEFIGLLPKNKTLDTLWLLENRALQAPLEEKQRNFGDNHNFYFRKFVERSRKINTGRAIHPGAIEKVLDILIDVEQQLFFIEKVDFDCSPDEAERIALRIVRGEWQASQTVTVLTADVPPRVRNALFRQIMNQGNVERTLEMLRWLESDRGAVGALSLEDALGGIDSFAALFDFASDVHKNLAGNQVTVLRQALHRTATNSTQRAKVRRLLPL